LHRIHLFGLCQFQNQILKLTSVQISPPEAIWNARGPPPLVDEIGEPVMAGSFSTALFGLRRTSALACQPSAFAEVSSDK
jgi:hypothetical protein